ncbi:MAG: transketolase C-terminal domain-containing protein, partial [Balneolaceae bacterium]|nr:transketolase C-terminal domain-containing protein [Balneolaceae bacterium]
KCNIIDIETANTVREGTDISIITYGLGVLWALEIADEYAEKSVNIEILDLRSLAPIDWKTVLQSVQKTGKVLLLQEPSEILGPMSEISSGIMEKGFEYLDAPVMRCSSLQTPIPFNKNMEEGYLAKARLKEKLDQLILY